MGNTTNMGNTPIIQQDGEKVNLTAQEVNGFASMLRDYESAVESGADLTAPLYALATACAHSVLKKCADPQRKTATERETVSNSGMNPAMLALKRGIVADLGTDTKPGHLAMLLDACNRATAIVCNQNGDYVQKTVDKVANDAITALLDETISDGMDLVHDAICQTLEETTAHCDRLTPGANWMETEYTERRLSRRVVIKSDESAKWEDETTTPIQEVYRGVRRAVQNSKAVQTDPRNGYLYLEDLSADPESNATEVVYIRLGKFADIGGYETDIYGKPRYNGAYTVNRRDAMEYDSILDALNLTARQAKITALRMEGHGVKAIATYLGVKPETVKAQLDAIRKKCEKIGFTPNMWKEMNREN